MWHYLLFKDTCGRVLLNDKSSNDGLNNFFNKCDQIRSFRSHIYLRNPSWITSFFMQWKWRMLGLGTVMQIIYSKYATMLISRLLFKKIAQLLKKLHNYRYGTQKQSIISAFSIYMTATLIYMVSSTKERNCLVDVVTLHKKWRFLLRISSVNVNKFAASNGFGHIY